MKAKEKIMEYVFLLTAIVSILAVALICIFLYKVHRFHKKTVGNKPTVNFFQFSSAFL